MHLGNAYAALAAWLARVPREGVCCCASRTSTPRAWSRTRTVGLWTIWRWLGLDWDGEPVYQSQRLDAYEEALRRLREQGLVYPCFCSRADIRAASAPNEGDGFLIYPGTCRRLPAAERESRVARGDRHSWRLAVPDAYADPDPASCAAPDPDTSVMSEHADSDISRVDRAACDAPTADCRAWYVSPIACLGRNASICRGSWVTWWCDAPTGLFAYQLAVSVDDMATGVTQIVRGRDLLRSTAIQLYVRRCLGVG